MLRTGGGSATSSGLQKERPEKETRKTEQEERTYVLETGKQWIFSFNRSSFKKSSNVTQFTKVDPVIPPARIKQLLIKCCFQNRKYIIFPTTKIVTLT